MHSGNSVDPSFYYILGRMISDSPPSETLASELSASTDMGPLSMGPKARKTPRGLIPWSVRIHRAGLYNRFSSAVLLPTGELIFTRHQYNRITERRDGIEVFVRLQAENGAPDSVYEVTVTEYSPDRDLVRGRINIPLPEINALNSSLFLAPADARPNDAYFCGWGRNDESGTAPADYKTDIVLRLFSDASIQPGPELSTLLQSWREDLADQLELSNLPPENWLENYLIYLHADSGPAAGDSGGGLVYLSEGRICLIGVLSQKRRLENGMYVSLFARV